MTHNRDAELRRLARAFRVAANNPAATVMHPKWVEGFRDGLRFAAAAMEAVADGNPTTEAVAAATAAL